MIRIDKAQQRTIINVIVLTIIAGAIFWIHKAGIIDFTLLEELVEGAGAYGLVVFGFVYIVLSMFGISKIAMTILAGALFSLTEAMVVTVVASTIAAGLGFYLTRYFKDYIERVFMRIGKAERNTMLQNAVAKIETNARKRGFYTIVILRLSFVPLMLISYASGLVSSLRARDFLAAVFFTNIYMHFVYIFLGTSLTRSLPMFAAALAVIILFVQTPRFIKKYT